LWQLLLYIRGWLQRTPASWADSEYGLTCSSSFGTGCSNSFMYGFPESSPTHDHCELSPHLVHSPVPFPTRS
jgi:hypothetical protein